MLSGSFENCYGIKKFTLPCIDFNTCNKAIIYAPNGVMKTSFAKVFEDISKGNKTTDRIFVDAVSHYSITYDTSHYIFSSDKDDGIPHSDNIYVINSFSDKFEFDKASVGTLLADEDTRKMYNELTAKFSGTITELVRNLQVLTRLTKPQIKAKLIDDLHLQTTADWPDIIDAIGRIEIYNHGFLSDIFYSELFNERAMAVYDNADFKKCISEYVTNLQSLLQDNTFLNNHFTEHSAEELGVSLSKNNFFDAQHKIILRDGTQINNLAEWRSIVQQQLDILYQDSALTGSFENLKKLFNKSADTLKVREIIVSHREIIPHLADIEALKLKFWRNCFERLERPFSEYSHTVAGFKDQVRELYERASTQSERWTEVVKVFNSRFRVPFTATIKNKSNYILKDEAPNIEFEFKSGPGNIEECKDLSKDELMPVLSMGERRALYLLYIVFDLERIREQAKEGKGRFLVIADDIADSFDYKNKYAIIEYLNDLADLSGIDLLMLTHNFDFYRTVMHGCKIGRENCYISQRNSEGIVDMTTFKYRNDFFNKVLRNSIVNGNLDTEFRRKCLIASLPFYRNLAEYTGNRDDYLKLTCCLHYKTVPFDTDKLMISDIWSVIRHYLNNSELISTDKSYMQLLHELALSICEDTDEVSLENKLVLSITARLQIEKFMKERIIQSEGSCPDETKYQTREWFKKATLLLNKEEKKFIEEILLVTPGSIHLNAFMYEPLIDVSAWHLKELYKNSKKLS